MSRFVKEGELPQPTSAKQGRFVKEAKPLSEKKGRFVRESEPQDTSVFGGFKSYVQKGLENLEESRVGSFVRGVGRQ